MPGFDRTGPMGHGPMSGRGFGPCGRGMGFRRGFGRGFGLGRGFGWQYAEQPYREPLTLTKEEQQKILKSELEAIEAEKEQVEKKLNELNEAQK